MKRYIILICVVVTFLWPKLSVAFEGLEDVEIHGFVAQGFLLSDKYDYYGIKTEEGSFEYSSAGINFSSNVSADLRIGAQFLVRDYGELGNDQIELDWAYGDYRVSNYLGIRGGKVKIASGLYNETRDIDAVRTFVLLPNAIYLEQLRDILAGMKGVCAYGEIPAGFSYQAAYGVTPFSSDSYLMQDITQSLSENLKRETSVQVSAAVTAALIAQGIPADMAAAQGAVVGTSAAAGIRIEIEGDSTSHNTKNFALQWAPHFLDGLRLSGTYYGSEVESLIDATIFNPAYLTDPMLDQHVTVPVTIHIDEVSSTVISAEYTFGDTILSAEYNMIKVDIDSFMGNPVPTTDILGWAVSASHRFKDRLELGADYADESTDLDDANGKDWERITGQ